ncbi:MAG TPA: hypothetical protein VNN20_14295 [Thermodesulfobacteriota bacterium]|nr:hypothetical protein [Thermodesulfobacteriota bacterium]
MNKVPGFKAEASLGRQIKRYGIDNKGVKINLRSKQDPVLPQQLSVPVYGNYCGPGFGDPTGNTPPIDAVDAVCREHDLCYGRRGYLDCQCDRNLIAYMPGAIARTSSVSGQIAGTAIMTFFSTTPCLCRNRICVPIPFVGASCSTVTLPGYGGICFV